MPEQTRIPTAYLLCGLPGSGKSTWCAKMAGDSMIAIINKDSFRNMLKGSYVFDKIYEPMIGDMVTECIQIVLLNRFDLILDECNISQTVRHQWLDVIDSLDIRVRKVCVWFTETERNLDNRMNEARGYDRSKWAEVIDGMRIKFDPPALSEGFHEIPRIPFGQDR